jgi:large subunit ribosomal protein L17
MRHRKQKKTLGRSASARKALLRDLATALFTYEKIQTSLGRAKVVRPVVEKLITTAKKDTLAARRQLLSYFTTDQTVAKLLEVIGPRYKTRAGGYTRLTKLGKRQGDAAETVLIELV